MHCPRCGHKTFSPTTACPACAFTGEAALIEELAHVSYLLSEMESWDRLSSSLRQHLQDAYENRRRWLEIELGLREPPLDAQAARAARQEISHQTVLLDELDHWVGQGWLVPETAEELGAEARSHIRALRRRLAGAPPRQPDPSEDLSRVLYRQRLAQLDFFQEKLNGLHAAGVLSAESLRQASAEIAGRVERLEIAAGLRPAPRPEPAPPPAAPPAPAPAQPAAPPPPPRPPRPPLTWDRIWEGLLSERTLRILLLVGVALLFAAALTLIFWNWNMFPPWLQVLFLTLLTGIFYGLGWYVRTRMGLRSSGIALSAVASLLIPLDFYAIYLSGGFPRELWNEVWLLASVVGLTAYLLTAYFVQAELFGYLAGGAVFSALAAAASLLGIDLNWWQTLLTALALALGLLAAGLERVRGRWRILAVPLWHVAPAAAGGILVLALGWAIVGRVDNDAFFAALVLDWWLGGLLFVLAAWHYRHWLVGQVAAFCFPIAVWLSQRVLFDLWRIQPAWHALGWALLAPLYLLVGWALLRGAGEGIRQTYGRTALWFSGALVVAAAVWSLTQAAVVGVIHPLLAATVIGAVVLWKKPGRLPLASLFLLTGAGGWVAGWEGSVGQLGLAWALLSILHVVAALGLRRFGRRAHPRLHYDGPVFVAGWAIAALALLPPLFTLDRAVLAYALGNLAGLSGWLALLLYGGEAPGLSRLLVARGLRPTWFHWAAALPLLPWAWLAWLGRRPAGVQLALAYLVLAGLLLGAGLWLRRARWAYGWPWLASAHAAGLVALVVGFRYYDQGWTALALLAAACFYAASARLLHQGFWLLPGGMLFALGWALGLDWLGLPREPLVAAVALLVPAYVGSGFLLERYRRVPRSFLLPFYHLSRVIGLLAFVGAAVLLLPAGGSDSSLVWTALAMLFLGSAAGLCAWLFRSDAFGHAAAWLGVFAGALVAAAYSQGRGSSAAKAALLAIAYVLAERALLGAGRWRRTPLAWRPFFRSAWRLYRRPLLRAGWWVSAGAIALALVRNLLLLGGGRARESWSVLALVLLVGLYALSAWLFRRRPYAPLFVWLAAVLVVAPWTLLAHMGWYVWGRSTAPAYALSWSVLALLELALGIWLARRVPAGKPLQVIAHLLLPLALFWGITDVPTCIWSFALGLGFYLLALWQDRRLWPRPELPARARFLYPAVVVLPAWTAYLLAHFFPSAPQVSYGWLLLAFTPVLFLGYWLEWREPAYSRAIYLFSAGAAVVATALVAYERPALIAVLLVDAALAAAATWLFRQPLWVYPAAIALPTALWLALAEWAVPLSRRGWGLIALSGLYLLAAWLLHGRRTPTAGAPARLGPYAAPLLLTSFFLVILGLVPSIQDRPGAMVGYGAAALLAALAALWQQRPALMVPAVGLGLVPYAVGVLELGVPEQAYGLAAWPAIALALLLAHGLDWRWGARPDARGEGLEPFPWADPARWLPAALERLDRWWALPFYAAAYAGAALSAFLSRQRPNYLALTLLLAALVYALATLRFRLRGWLLLAVGAVQLALLAAFRWWGWWENPAAVALRFVPVTWTTALAGLAVERWRKEGPPLAAGWRAALRGWSRPLYALLVADVLACQVASLSQAGQGAWISCGQALLLALLVTFWAAPLLPYLALSLGALSLFQGLLWRQAAALDWPTALALLALAYGLAGCLLSWWRHWGRPPLALLVWERPGRRSGMLLSAISLFLAAVFGMDALSLTMRAALGQPLVRLEELPQVQMVAGVLSLLGLFYLLVAVVDRRRRLGYGAVAMLLGAWSLEWLWVWGMREVQWYALPAGLYLLAVGYLEWTYGSQPLARWIDQLAMLLLLGSAFWQALSQQGLLYALLMIAEGLLMILWGSARRLRRFLYTGPFGILVGVLAVAIDPLFRGYRWAVFGLAGLLIIAVSLLIERNMDRVRERLKEME